MRILANYGYRDNGESYSVTFETTGDVQMGRAPETVDELFRLAKEAIQRQVKPREGKQQPATDSDSSSAKPDSQQDKGNGGNGKAKASEKQINYMYNLIKRAKNLSGFHAIDYLKKEFNVQSVNNIPSDQARLFISKIKEENEQKQNDFLP
ncbi:MAG: hypothetical protein ABII25_04760 [bacterium]